MGCPNPCDKIFGFENFIEMVLMRPFYKTDLFCYRDLFFNTGPDNLKYVLLVSESNCFVNTD